MLQAPHTLPSAVLGPNLKGALPRLYLLGMGLEILQRSFGCLNCLRALAYRIQANHKPVGVADYHWPCS